MNTKIYRPLILGIWTSYSFLLGVIACQHPGQTTTDQLSPIVEVPVTIPVGTKQGYQLSPFTKDSARIVINAFGDTVRSGTHYTITGKVIAPEKVEYPRILKAGKPKIRPAYNNSFPLNGHIKEMPVDEKKLRRFIPGKESQNFILTNTIGDTIQSGIPIPVNEKKVKCLFPPTVSIKSLTLRSDACSNIQILDVDQGLLNSNINALQEDQHGNLWIGLYGGGVIRYDGSTGMMFTKYNRFVNNFITATLLDKKGNIWMATEGGLCRFDGTYITTFTIGNGLSSPYITCLAEDKNGNIWFGSQEGGASCYTPPKENEPGTLTHYTLKEGINEMYITAILEDRNGNLWFGSKSRGVSMFEPAVKGSPATVTYFTHEQGLSGNKIFDIMEDKAGNIWFGTDQGACWFTVSNRTLGGTMTQYQFNFENSNYPVQQIYQDREGNIWLGTLGGGAIKLVQKDSQDHMDKFERYTQTEGLSSNRITAILEDSAGNIWLGTKGGGVCRINANPIHHYGEREGLTSNTINAMYEDPDGNIWYGTNGDGLILYRPPKDNQQGMFSHYTNEEGLPENFITSIAGDREGDLWIGTNSSGVCQFDGKSFITYTDKCGLSGNDVKTVMIDRKRNLWVGSSHGISFLEGESSQGYHKAAFVNFTEEEGLLENFIYTIYEDSHENIWVGSKRGISKFQMSSMNHSGSILHFTEKEGLPFWYVLTVTEDHSGNMWIGTGKGLLCYHSSPDTLSGTFTRYAPEGDQMKGINETMRSVQQDYLGNIWFGTEGGINLLVEQNDSTRQYRYRQFTKEDGLKGNTFLANSVVFDHHHLAWWGNTYGGAEMINLEQCSLSTIIPQPELKGLEINERFIDFHNRPDSLRKGIDFDSVMAFENYPSGLRLSSRFDNLTFHFAAIDWSAPHKIRYSFHMKGLNNNWSLPSNETKAEFRSIPYGRYTFEVRAFGESQQWSPVFEYPFRIRPPWWYSWWAYVSYSLIGCSVIYSGYRFQLKRKLELAEKNRLVELDQVKNRLYSNIAHEFRTPLTLIHGPITQALTNKASLNHKDIQSIYKQSERLQQLINQMLDLQKLEAGKLKPNYESGDVMQILRVLFNSFEVWAREKNIILECTTDPQALYMDFDQEKLTQIISNLVSNAIKHTPRNGRVTMMISTSTGDNSLFIWIEDTGVGIDEEDLPFIFERFYQSKRAAIGGSGIGLALTKNLIELLGGSITVESTLDLGSTFKVALPIHHKATKMLNNVSNADLRIPAAYDEEIQFTTSDSVSSGKPIILIIEDHPEIAQYVASCLASEYSILIAPNGNEGMRMAYEHIPDLIISDVMMPGKDGFELTGILKTDIQTSHIPIILLTGRGDHDAFISGIERGADAYVTKPFDPSELVLRVKKLLELRANLSLYYRHQTPAVEKEMRERISPRENEFMKQLRSIVEEHLNDAQFNMNMLSKYMAMSHPQLHRKITALTGESVGKFVRSVRLAKAIELLKNSDLTISEVAYETGFSDPGYFTKIFSKEMNMTPTDYRGSLSG